MIHPALLMRLLYINLVLVRHGLDELIIATHLFRPVRFLIYLAPWYWLRGKRAPRGVRIRRALEDLGPIFVKFGQILSTRRDLLPDDIAEELARLQDRVPPFPGAQARAIIQQTYGKPLAELFRTLDETPLASASIAQVHAATLHDGREVVVKVLRPGIERVIRRDVSLMFYVAGLAERYWREGRRLRPREVVAEFEKVIYDELDLVREAANATQLRRNFEGSALLYVPEAYWPLARTNVIVMERISGTPISDIEALRRQGIDLKRLAEDGVEIFYTQVFRHNFFHADMHPGNIFVSPEGQYIAVDFGIMGTLTPEDQRYLAENFLAFFNRDYRRVAQLHLESGWIPPGTRVDEFESAIRTVCEPNFNRPLKDISFGQVLLRLFQTARRFNMEVQPQLVLLQKTLLNIEGLGRQLYPDLDLWTTAKPFLERWMSEQLGARAFARRMRENVPQWSEKLPELPLLMHDYLRRAAKGARGGDRNGEVLERLRGELRRSNRRTVTAISGAALVVSAALLLGLDGYAPRMIADVPIGTWVLGTLGALLLVGAAWRR
ncbi:MAG: ubiquinone biosynthesis regulatory protein kinase UbiB [Gammaproteobacteria bacterium]|nr:ubiquinone biosynthesis regulatory protein kinase UbiB [Gammaproteobacteria bacterium]NIR98672.1 ubiquinone biosynthesis regulatory protein kinase UbiB [Gammaproteobacteria bacterium]NIT64384.1 ubiquinone biosynthesis regulatory protein kinase UbiB [Gammaproteobacteria bacterium]NIV19483.1 ubiquinone biosynthesis regulatory protein kinase UbiB [Gammaproteobacteria bacterium]NIY32964.1 ubiquinone biosynthesis regulatory protein kinase UbiB [Gammaproteobacteria bacterium]